jgi:hypothetical protein
MDIRLFIAIFRLWIEKSESVGEKKCKKERRCVSPCVLLIDEISVKTEMRIWNNRLVNINCFFSEELSPINDEEQSIVGNDPATITNDTEQGMKKYKF